MIIARMDFAYSHVRLFDLLLDIEETNQEFSLQANHYIDLGSHCTTRAVDYAFGGGYLWNEFTMHSRIYYSSKLFLSIHFSAHYLS